MRVKPGKEISKKEQSLRRLNVSKAKIYSTPFTNPLTVNGHIIYLGIFVKGGE